MTWAPKETQITLFQTLTGDATLSGLLGGSNRVYDHVPDNTDYPYLVIKTEPWADRGNHSYEGLSAQIEVKTFYRAPGRGRLKVQDIQARIDALLHSQNLCVDGWNIVVLRRSLVDIIVLEDNVTLMGIQRFNLMLGEA